MLQNGTVTVREVNGWRKDAGRSTSTNSVTDRTTTSVAGTGIHLSSSHRHLCLPRFFCTDSPEIDAARISSITFSNALNRFAVRGQRPFTVIFVAKVVNFLEDASDRWSARIGTLLGGFGSPDCPQGSSRPSSALRENVFRFRAEGVR